MTRELQLQSWLFSCKSALNGTTAMNATTIREGLSHCLCAENEAVNREAARLLREHFTARIIAQ